MKKTLKKLIIGSLTVQLAYLPAYAEEDLSGQMAFAQCNEYINIRADADIESAIVGKVYNNGAVTILGEQEGWYKIHSGNVEGYVDSQYFVTGADAASIAEQTAYNVATVYPEALIVRAAASEDSEAIGTVYANDEIDVISYDGDWMYVWVDGMTGYISAYYVEYDTFYPVAESIEEEQYRLQQVEINQSWIEEGTYETEPYVKPEETYDWWYQSDDYYFEQAEANGEDESLIESIPIDESFFEAETEVYALKETEFYEQEEGYYDADLEEYVYVEDGGGQYIVDYATQFLGNPYVYGGTSLTDGADCSGFTQSVFADNGIYIPRTAAQQSASGTPISLNDIQAGDLLFYDSGYGVDHVSIYMGNGQVIHASNPNVGIIISDYSYRTPISASRYW